MNEVKIDGTVAFVKEMTSKKGNVFQKFVIKHDEILLNVIFFNAMVKIVNNKNYSIVGKLSTGMNGISLIADLVTELTENNPQPQQKEDVPF